MPNRREWQCASEATVLVTRQELYHLLQLAVIPESRHSLTRVSQFQPHRCAAYHNTIPSSLRWPGRLPVYLSGHIVPPHRAYVQQRTPPLWNDKSAIWTVAPYAVSPAVLPPPDSRPTCTRHLSYHIPTKALYSPTLTDTASRPITFRYPLRMSCSGVDVYVETQPSVISHFRSQYAGSPVWRGSSWELVCCARGLQTN